MDMEPSINLTEKILDMWVLSTEDSEEAWEPIIMMIEMNM